jgi:hypothetical protein
MPLYIYMCLILLLFNIFFFYSAISGSFYILFKLKELLFNKIYNKIIIINYKAYILFFNLKLYNSLFKFKSFIFIILSFITIFLLYVLKFILGLIL